jgi:V/A-type H+-transporting ATPase subunit I
MAIASMKKVMIVTHCSESERLLETLQQAGTVQVLDAERAMVTKEWPELQSVFKRPHELEDKVDRLHRAILSLKPYTKRSGGFLRPLTEVAGGEYARVAHSSATMELLEKTEKTSKNIEKYGQDIDGLTGEIEKYRPWMPLALPVEQLGGMSSSVCFTGLVPDQSLDAVGQTLDALGAMVKKIGPAHRAEAWVVLCLKEAAPEIQKALRQADFEVVGFEGHKGTVTQIVADLQARLTQRKDDLQREKQVAAELAKELLSLQILHGHYKNLIARVYTRDTAPASAHTMFLEGWVKAADYAALEKSVSRFEATSVSLVEPGEDEEPPVEIVNHAAFRPFETITRLYGTPAVTDVDPTAFLAPFFAMFFGLCLTDAGYGLVVVLLLAWILKKMQGDKKAMWMLLICGVAAIVAGAITGGWFGDTIQTLLPQGEGRIGTTLELWRQKIMLFDPMQQPLIFIGISLSLGYIQIVFGLAIGFYSLLRQRQYAAAVFEKLTWLILLNCILVYALAKNAVLPPATAAISGWLAIVQFALIFWFTERHSGLAGRIGGGAFAVFSTVFYMGDMLSYVRLMALGMVSAGLGMAINILTKLLMDVPYIGFVLGMLMFVVGHVVNILLSLLSSFVHSLRLQFVEFFPKFFVGGGREFSPLRNEYKHVMIVQNETKK